MNVASIRPVGPSPFELDAQTDVREAKQTARLGERAAVTFDARWGRRNLWVVASVGAREIVALRAGHGSDDLTNASVTSTPAGTVFEFASASGAFRAKIAYPADDRPTLRCTTSFLPARDTSVPFWPRDLYVLNVPSGTVHTTQRGLRSGIVFASAYDPSFSLFYFQNFSSLSEYFELTKRSPSDSVGGTWPELGYAPPAGDDCVLPGSREVIVSDVYLTISDAYPKTDAEVAATYLDLLAETYNCLPRPSVEYHDWPGRASKALHDLSLSPHCTDVRHGQRYLMPYVGDRAKPPESMVQLTVAVNAGEYDRWRADEGALTTMLRDTASSFFDDEVGSIVRWLPGEAFEPSQAEDNMNHDAMDSWYLHHALFNLSRLAAEGDLSARELFRRSLPFAIRVARRFNYEWPVFFNLRTLDVIRAESAPGKGGEHDVAGLYALVLLHAHDLFADPEFLEEAERAALQLQGRGFALGYQMNTTGFAAEAAMRLWKLTGKRTFLELSEICMANLFDNMWLWQCDYGKARHYRTFFGLFPLRDAPYLAAYEELEALGKFHEYLPLGGGDVRPSLRLLLAEYQKYSLDRCWYYYPDELPRDLLSEKPRNGSIERTLAVPIEDLQDGWESSGQVGQELYGAGLPFVYTSRHYVSLPGSGCLAFCDYPMYDFQVDSSGRGASWRADGDPRCTAELRVIPQDANREPTVVSVITHAGDIAVPLRGSHTVEGHAAFEIRGGQTLEIRLGAPDESAPKGAVVIGGPRRRADQRS